MLPPPSRRWRAALMWVATAVVIASLSACVPEPAVMATSSPTPLRSGPSASPSTTPPSSTTIPTIAATRAPTNGPSQIDVVIVTIGAQDGAIEASGIVASTPEDGGICRMEATMNNTTRVTEGAATRGPESNFCGLLVIPADQLQSGSWSVRLSYASSTSSGRSDASIVEIK